MDQNQTGHISQKPLEPLLRTAFRQEILYLLQDPEIRQALRGLFPEQVDDLSVAEMAEAGNCDRQNQETILEKTKQEKDALSKANAVLEEERQSLKSQNASLLERMKQQENQYQASLRAEVSRCQKQEESAQRAKKEAEDEIISLQQKLKTSRKQLDDDQVEFSLLQEEMDKLRGQLKTAREKSAPFEAVEPLYREYLALPGMLQASLRSIRTDTLWSFTVCCMKWETIEALWEMAAIETDPASEIRLTLGKIFRLFFGFFQESGEPVELVEPTLGESNDESLHARAQGSTAVLGRIDRVVLPGYRKGSKLIKKALVVVK